MNSPRDAPSRADLRGSTVVRYLEAASLVLVWMVLGWLLRLDPYQYLAVGIPLTYLFQVGVRGQPLTSLWVRASTAFRLDRWGMLLVLVLLAIPATLLLPGLRAGGWSRRLWI